MRSRSFALLLAVLLPITLVGCDLLGSDDSGSATATGVYVANGGGFGNQNSSLTIYDPETGASQTLPSNGSGFSSYIQSLTLSGDQLFVVFGETGTVDIYAPDTGSQSGQISGIPNPRYVATSDESAYITSQDYGPDPSDLDVVDRSTNTVVDSVNVTGTPEDVAVADGRVVVALGGFNAGSSVALVSPSDLSVETLDVGCTGPRSLVTDAENEVHVFCTGRAPSENSEGVPGEVVTIDPSESSVMSSAELSTQIASRSLAQYVSYSAAAEEAHAILASGELLRFDTADNSVAGRIDVSGAPVGAVAYSPSSERLFVGRLAASGNPFSTPGTVTIHERDGTPLDTLAAGVAPSHIAVDRE
jgi:hypothetical protein